MTHSDSLSCWTVPALRPTWKNIWLTIKIRLRGKFSSTLETKCQVKFGVRQLKKDRWCTESVFLIWKAKPDLTIFTEEVWSALLVQKYIPWMWKYKWHFYLLFIWLENSFSCKWSDTCFQILARCSSEFKKVPDWIKVKCAVANKFLLFFCFPC